MAEPDKDQKTHEPTEKKLEDARRKGEVASSPEVKHALMLAAGVAVAGWLGSAAIARFGTLFQKLWGRADDFVLSPDGGQALAARLMGEAAAAMAPLMALLVGSALLIPFLQGRPSFAWNRIGPKWSKLSPAKGLGRLFGPRALVEFGKTLLKFLVVTSVAVAVVWPKAAGLDRLVGAGPEAIGRAAGALVFAMFQAVAILVAALALFDFVYQRRAFLKRMRMSLQEVKDEHKQNDGDPQVKARRRGIAVQRARKRMMAAVPEASVVVTNPTHYAVALKYDHGAMAAPVVVAKGVDAVALKIRKVAGAAGVPVVESPPLARALYAGAELDRPIPIEHYAAVAEIIGYVMRLARGRR
jgi:flagellar biosynthesis protein FlhB